MITKDAILGEVRKFIKRKYPEILSDLQECYVMEEFAAILYEMMVGEYDHYSSEVFGENMQHM